MNVKHGEEQQDATSINVQIVCGNESGAHGRIVVYSLGVFFFLFFFRVCFAFSDHLGWCNIDSTEKVLESVLLQC